MMIKPYFETKLGKLYHGDCLDIMKEFPENHFDLCLTDPPYGLDYQSNRGAKTGNLKDKIKNDGLDDYLGLIKSFRIALETLLDKDSEAYIFCGGGGGEPVLAYAWIEYKKSEIFKVKNVLIWDKMIGGMGWDWRFQYETIFQLQCGNGVNNNMDGSNRYNVIRVNNIVPQAGQHPTEKPLALMFKILKAKPSRITIDPFAGSCTTLVACERLGRRWVGIEIEEKYCEMGAQRILAESQQGKLFETI